MTTYTAKRKALERAINDLLCNCDLCGSCATCDHLPVCAMACRTKHLISEDKLNDCNNDFAVWADNYIRGMFGNDNSGLLQDLPVNATEDSNPRL